MEPIDRDGSGGGFGFNDDGSNWKAVGVDPGFDDFDFFNSIFFFLLLAAIVLGLYKYSDNIKDWYGRNFKKDTFEEKSQRYKLANDDEE